MLRALVAGARGEAVDAEPLIARDCATRFARTRSTPRSRPRRILLPSESLIGDRMDRVDPDAIHDARERLARAPSAPRFGDDLARGPRRHAAPATTSRPRAKGARRLRSVALGLLAAGDPREGAALAKAQFDAADNMTDRQGALGVLVSLDVPEREAALDAFYDRFTDDPLVSTNGSLCRPPRSGPTRSTRSSGLRGHPDFTIANPNRLRALAGSFAPTSGRSTTRSGRGYRFLADMILAADKLNPQVAARLVPPLGRWRRFDEPPRARCAPSWNGSSPRPAFARMCSSRLEESG